MLTWQGQPQEGIDWIKKAMRLNPYHPQRFWSHLGRAYFVARRYSESVEAFKRISVPDHVVHTFLAAALAQAGGGGVNRYHINLFCSETDSCWVADVPDLKSCSAFGATAAEALAEVETAID